MKKSSIGINKNNKKGGQRGIKIFKKATPCKFNPITNIETQIVVDKKIIKMI
jgi:hypothetical protein